MTDAEIRRCLREKFGLERYRGYAKSRRDRLRARKLCINGESHGAATHGDKCGWCWDVHKRGIASVLESPMFPRPPETKWRKRKETA